MTQETIQEQPQQNDKPTTQPSISPSLPSPQNKNTVQLLILIVTILILIALSVLIGMEVSKKTATSMILQEQQPPITQQESTGQPTPVTPTNIDTPTPKNTTTSIDSAWNLYTNHILGFSMKIPKTATEYGGTCANGTLGERLVPLKTLEYEKGVYITFEYFFDRSANTTCTKIPMDLPTIDTRANAWKTNPTSTQFVPSNWNIIVSDITTDADLERFVQNRYGTGCKVGAKTLSTNGTYDVKVLGDGLDMEETQCPINFMLALKYSPDKKKAATWGIGQEVVFSSEGHTVSYDQDMVKSFTFLP